MADVAGLNNQYEAIDGHYDDYISDGDNYDDNVDGNNDDSDGDSNDDNVDDNNDDNDDDINDDIKVHCVESGSQPTSEAGSKSKSQRKL